jgi:hypothetical protein
LTEVAASSAWSWRAHARINDIDQPLHAAYDPWMGSWSPAARVGLWIAAISAIGCHTATPTSGATEAASAYATGPTKPACPPAPSARAVDDASTEAGPAPTASALHMHGIVHHGYGCGGHCAFNFSGESDVGISFGASGKAVVQDAGWFMRSDAYPDSYVDTKRTWRLEWQGTWSGDDRRRKVRLEPACTSCETTESGSHKSGPTPCAKGPAVLDLECAWEQPPTGQRGGRSASPTDLGPLAVAWICQTSSTAPSELGTDLPWVFSPSATVERRTVGEPFPETSYGTECRGSKCETITIPR